MSFVRIENVSKHYDELHVLKNISLSIEEGEFVTLLGPSGCGKSTLLRAIAGLNDIDAGNIFVGDRDITALAPKEREVGMVFQSYALFPNMNVFNNIAFGLKMDGMKKQEIKPLVDDMIALMDLQGKESMYPRQLSGGQQQRVALGRSLVKRPKILLLDEPLSALDAKIRRTLRTEIRQIQQKLKMTTIFVTHDQEEALTISDRIFVMNQGQVEQEGSPEDIYLYPRTKFVAAFIGNYNVWSKSEIANVNASSIPEGELFAIRPEAIELFSTSEESALSSDNVHFKGKVVQSIVLGNVKRFEVDANGLLFTVDLLHDSKMHWITNGKDVIVSVPSSECKVLTIPS